jgi:hypothetical protein
MSRRLHHRALAAAVALVIGLGLASCTTSDGEPEKTKTEIGDAQTADPTTTTASTAPATTTTAPIATTGSDTPEHAAQALYDAWKAGDKAGAGAVATQEAVDGIWKTAPGDYSLYNKCDTAEFGGSSTSGCLFRGMSGTIQFSMQRQGDFWVVVQAFFAEP